ncbi:hypothetical protein ABH15_12275 [Methanoculleus taiwanensis]|uniref:Uncharacterized protein n=1 Tax=Methanoculleus taiwanensis TaxID=1550565 RepID=A0A498GXH3_9EURY|nr:hypothetical protein [Methanoculleus taiwanensis]RXE55491.1 hypothetical protein ABH15_12275 [Methanoculleus taiwanensis]
MDIGSGTTEPIFAVEGRRFPSLTATTLDGKTMALPEDLSGDLSLIVIAFPRWVQQVQETWTGPFEYAFSGNPRVKAYLVTVVAGRLGEALTSRVDETLRGALPPEKHDRVLTYAGNFDDYARQLGFGDISLAYLYLLDGEGTIRWAEKGTTTPKGVDSLLNAARTILEEFR